MGLSACLSSAPPAAPVRFFDASPEQRAAVPTDRPLRLRFTAAPYLNQPFAVRIGPRELVFDPLHSWIAAPAVLVEAAFEYPPAGPTGETIEVHVARFELDLVGESVARVRLELRAPGKPSRVVEGTCPAPVRDPEDVAAAMATALGRAASALAGEL